MKLSVDRTKCSGHGRCYSLAPDYFDCDDEGFPVVLIEQVGDSDLAQVQHTVANCPERALVLEGP